MKEKQKCCLCGSEHEPEKMMKIFDGMTLKDTGERSCKKCAKKSYKAKGGL
jgi:hypothetical protein